MAALGAVAVSSFTACGGGSSGAGKAGDTDVASISGPAASAGSAGPNADPDSGRPNGLKVVGLPDNAGRNHASDSRPADSDEIESSCLLEAFSAKK